MHRHRLMLLQARCDAAGRPERRDAVITVLAHIECKARRGAYREPRRMPAEALLYDAERIGKARQRYRRARQIEGEVAAEFVEDRGLGQRGMEGRRIAEGVAQHKAARCDNRAAAARCGEGGDAVRLHRLRQMPDTRGVLLVCPVMSLTWPSASGRGVTAGHRVYMPARS